MQHERTFRPQRKRWPLPREKWPGCARLSRLLPVVVILTIALCFSSCATTKKTQTQQEQTFSTSEKSDTTAAVTRLIATQPVPESRVSLAVSVDSLLKLPEGAAYRESNDRAHVEATHQGGVIYITGTCDSLQRQVEYYEALYHTARNALEQKQDELNRAEEGRRDSSLFDKLYLLATGIAAGASFTTIFRIFKKDQK